MTKSMEMELMSFRMVISTSVNGKMTNATALEPTLIITGKSKLVSGKKTFRSVCSS